MSQASLLDQAEALRIMQANAVGTPVGFQVLRDPNPPRCTKGCMAPGSSPHAHADVVGWRLIGATGYVELGTDLRPTRVGMLHPFEDSYCTTEEATNG